MQAIFLLLSASALVSASPTPAPAAAAAAAVVPLPPKTHCVYDPLVGPWTLDPYLSKDIAKGQTVSSRATLPHAPDFPASFQGSWWFNNSEPTNLVSITSDQVVQVSPLQFKFPIYFHGYGYDNSPAGVSDWQQSVYENIQVKLTFSESKQFARIEQTFIASITPPSFVDNFDLFVDTRDPTGNTWIRNSSILGIDIGVRGDYIVHKVIEADGTVLPLFDDWLAFNKARTGSDYVLLGNKRSWKEFQALCL